MTTTKAKKSNPESMKKTLTKGWSVDHLREVVKREEILPRFPQKEMINTRFPHSLMGLLMKMSFQGCALMKYSGRETYEKGKNS